MKPTKPRKNKSRRRRPRPPRDALEAIARETIRRTFSPTLDERIQDAMVNLAFAYAKNLFEVQETKVEPDNVVSISDWKKQHKRQL